MQRARRPGAQKPAHDDNRRWTVQDLATEKSACRSGSTGGRHKKPPVDFGRRYAPEGLGGKHNSGCSSRPATAVFQGGRRSNFLSIPGALRGGGGARAGPTYASAADPRPPSKGRGARGRGRQHGSRTKDVAQRPPMTEAGRPGNAKPHRKSAIGCQIRPSSSREERARSRAFCLCPRADLGTRQPRRITGGNSGTARGRGSPAAGPR